MTFIEETHELVVHETIASPGPNPGSIAIHEITAAGISETTSLSFSPAVSEGVVEASAPDDTDFALPNTQGHLA